MKIKVYEHYVAYSQLPDLYLICEHFNMQFM
jgi:hypothetical protein